MESIHFNIYNGWFFLSIFLLILWLYNKIWTIKYEKIVGIIDNLNTYLRLDLFLIGFLITIIFQVKDYIPIWYSSLFLKLNNLLPRFLSLIILLFFLLAYSERHSK